jgi:hypothetical protein
MRARSLLLALLVAGCARRAAPSDEIPTVARDLSVVRDWFEQHADSTRVVALLSPT